MKGPSNMSLVSASNRSANNNNNMRNSDYTGMASEGGVPANNVMMNNFAGPSDTQNFATSDFIEGQEHAGFDGDDTPFMGNHVVKTVRNLRMR